MHASHAHVKVNRLWTNVLSYNVYANIFALVIPSGTFLFCMYENKVDTWPTGCPGTPLAASWRRGWAWSRHGALWRSRRLAPGPSRTPSWRKRSRWRPSGSRPSYSAPDTWLLLSWKQNRFVCYRWTTLIDRKEKERRIKTQTAASGIKSRWLLTDEHKRKDQIFLRS